MGFRTVIIKNRAKLEVQLNSLIIRGEQEKKVFIDGKNTTLDLAIRQFTKIVFHALEKEDVSLLIFPESISKDE